MCRKTELTICVDVEFGKPAVVDLHEILTGEYTVIGQPKKGRAELSGGKLKYTPRVWLLERDGSGFTDREYEDWVKVAVKNGSEGEIITLNITIGKLDKLFYNKNGEWIRELDLLFSRETLAAVKAEAQADPKGLRTRLIQNALDKADDYLGEVPELYTEGTLEDSFETKTGDVAVHFLMAYLLTKDVPGREAENVRYLQKTVQWISTCLSYPYWGTTTYSHRNSDRAAGHLLFATSMVYHWLKDELADVVCTDVMGDETEDGQLGTITTTENMPILAALQKRLWYVGGILCKHSRNYNIYVMNHLHIRFSGLMAAAVALRSDARTQEQRQTLIDWTGMALYKAGRGMDSLMPDGTSQEGLTYWAYGADWLIRIPIISRQTLGIDLFENTGIYSRSTDYVLYSLVSQKHWGVQGVFNIGDAFPELNDGISHILRTIAGEYQDPVAQWLAQRAEDCKIDPRFKSAIWMSVIFADTALVPKSPIDGNLATLKWFHDLDLVVSRSDWSGNEAILVTKTGIPTGKHLYGLVKSGEYDGDPDAGHAHPQANHVTLYANGEYLLRDDFYACPKLTSNHNTLLVDGKGQLGDEIYWLDERAYIAADAIPCIKLARNCGDYDYIVGDATQAYDRALGLTKFERNMIFLKKENVLLIADDIRTDRQVQLELRWFSDCKAVEKAGGCYQITGAHNEMRFYPFTAPVSYEEVEVARRRYMEPEFGFRQSVKSNIWQNAVAFSWNETGRTPAEVVYEKLSDGLHSFAVNGRRYTVDTAENRIFAE